jgi:GNAT superfamily N-acetyltransferase
VDKEVIGACKLDEFDDKVYGKILSIEMIKIFDENLIKLSNSDENVAKGFKKRGYDNIDLSSKYIGKKYGTLMMEYILTYARDNGFKVVTGFPINKFAENLNKKYGFRKATDEERSNLDPLFKDILVFDEKVM